MVRYSIVERGNNQHPNPAYHVRLVANLSHLRYRLEFDLGVKKY